MCTEVNAKNMVKTVKARAHYGANSLNLTIPAEFCREYNLKAGDIYEITITEKKKEICLIYKRIYSSRDK